MSDFRPHDQESAWEFLGIGAAVFVFAIVALGWRTALRWCGDCALDRRARRERLQEEEALRERVRLAVRRTATRWTGKKPLVDVLVIRA